MNRVIKNRTLQIYTPDKPASHGYLPLGDTPQGGDRYFQNLVLDR